jgi:hypothetical protein
VAPGKRAISKAHAKAIGEMVESAQLDDLAPRRFRFAFGNSPQNWKRRFIADVAFQIGQVDQ